MHMAGHDFQCDDFGYVFRRNLAEKLCASLCNPVFEHFAPVSRTPDDGVLARIDDVVVRFVAGDHGYAVLQAPNECRKVHLTSHV